MVTKTPKIKIMQNEEFALSKLKIKISLIIINNFLFDYFFVKKIT